jgi:hypothetical protein
MRLGRGFASGISLAPAIGLMGVLGGLMLALGACNGSGSVPPPTAPSTPVPVPRTQPPAATFSNVTLSGFVFEQTVNGREPVEAVEVYCEPCGAETHTWAETDSNGFYSFNGFWGDGTQFPTPIWVLKEGYADPAGLPQTTPPNPSGPGWREVVVNGDTRFDIELVRK